MDIISIKCSSKKHDKNEAITFCQICKVYMCSKCTNLHSELFEEHKVDNMNQDSKLIFTGICNEERHKQELEYFCKSHNKLCCAACISKIRSKGNGEHKYCTVCNIEEIKEEKKNKLKENINNLESLSDTIEDSINELKIIIEEMNKNKEELKIEIQKIFTKIRNSFNEREDELLFEVDKVYDHIYFNENIIKKVVKLPSKIKISLEKGKLIENLWDEKNNNLNSLINDCINIENNINDINKANENITKYKSIKNGIIFKLEDDINVYVDTIQNNFGKIEIREENIYKYIKIIKKLDEYKYITVKPKLIYDAKKDGPKPENCHSKCNNVSNTLSLIETDNGSQFALFRNKPINGDGPWICDNKSFFISLDKNKVYKIKINSYAIGFDNNYYIQTYRFALSGDIFNNNFNSINKSSMNEHFEGFTDDYELTGGEKNFKVENFYVFQLEIEDPNSIISFSIN